MNSSSTLFQGKEYFYTYEGDRVLSITDESGAVVDNPLIWTVVGMDLKLYYKDMYMLGEVA
jgi:hypothetical protein